MVTFHRERFAQTVNECLPLFDLHWSEIHPYKDMDYDPALDKYIQLEEAGAVKMFSCRLGSELVGYAIFIVQPSLHQRNSIQAVQDVLFIHKEQRGIGGSFVKWCDEQLKNDGVQIVYHYSRASHDWGKALDRIGYKLLDQVWAKRLDQ